MKTDVDLITLAVIMQTSLTPRAMLETLTSIRRAGADIILTYYARDAARLLA